MVNIITTRYKLEKDDNLQKEVINQIIELTKRISDYSTDQIRIIIGVQKIKTDDEGYY